ncbi:hypothetical protein [Lederbergia galactosidilytica]|uniref:hypothetical protein n=1 Tax=Lederbergia galactosidilytica TaxID=217031 RepID=UPI00071704B0|nr:hypothetical protein [Lederbergia galactosidilytica]MBP1915608.1 hypothetical protein [Lederbergia galactosidilytica]
MFSKMKFFTICCIGLLLLASCGDTSNNSDPSTGNADFLKDSGVADKEQSTADTNTDTIQNSNKPESNQPEKEESVLDENEKILHYASNDNLKSETANLKKSDTQNYALYVLPGYTLTGEEPNKDVLYLEENSEQFMRIELLPKDTVMDEAISTIKEQLTSINGTIRETPSENRGDWLKNANVYQTQNNEELIIGLLKEDKDYVLKLTIFTRIKQDYANVFLNMAETIYMP